MIEFISIIEMLIDRLLLYLPSKLFVEVPFLTALLSDPNGRYVLSGVVVVMGLISLWIIFSILQLIFLSLFEERNRHKLREHIDPVEQRNESLSDGFQFFKRKELNVPVGSKVDALRLIEQEMLAIRKNFTDGIVLKDIYVFETKRLYVKAKELKT